MKYALFHEVVRWLSPSLNIKFFTYCFTFWNSIVRFTTASSLCCIFWPCISLLFCLKDCKISTWYPYMYIIPIISDILHPHTYTYNVLFLLCDHTIHPIFPSSTSSFFCLYQFFGGGLTCHYYLFHNMFGVFVYQYCVIRVPLCLITSTFVLYKKKKTFLLTVTL